MPTMTSEAVEDATASGLAEGSPASPAPSSSAACSADGAADGVSFNIPPRIRFTFLASLAMGVLIHAFVLANSIPNHDDVVLGAEVMEVSIFNHHGRWLFGLAMKLTGDFSLRWFNGLVGLTFLSVATCFTVSLLDLRSRPACFLAAALMAASPTVASILSYMVSAHAMLLSLALATAGCWLCQHYRFGFAAGAAALILSLGIYQGFLPTAATLSIAALLLGMLRDGRGGRETFFRGLRFLAMLAAGTAGYLGISKLVMGGAEFSSYQNIDKMGQIDLAKMPEALRRAYLTIPGFFGREIFAQPAYFRFIFAAILLAALFIALAAVRGRKLYRKPGEMVLLVLLTGLFPLAVGLAYIMNVHSYAHNVQGYALIFPLVLALAFVEIPWPRNRARLLASWTLILGAGAYAYNYARVDNEGYQKLHFTYEHTYGFFNGFLTRLQSAEGYNEKTRLVAVGVPRIPAAPKDPRLRRLRASRHFTGMVNPNSLMHDGRHIQRFLTNFLGFPSRIQWLPDDENLPPAFREQADAMPIYPADGSIRRLDDDTLLIKFGVMDY